MLLCSKVSRCRIPAGIASQLDQTFFDGRCTDATVALLRQMRRSFGI
jgi:hypothetical protein